MPIIDPDSGETTHYGFSSYLPLIDIPRPASLSLANLPAHVIRSSNLPSDLHLELLDLFYAYQNGIYTFIERPRFCRNMHDGGPEYSLFMHLCILATAAHLSDCPELRSDRDNPATAGIGLAAEAWQLLPSEMIRPRVSTVVGLCLLSNIASQFGGGDGLGWIVIGLAVRIAYHLGLNIKCRSGPEGCDTRDRAFWAVYHTEKLWSFYFGREATLMDEIGDVGLSSPPEIRLTVLLGALGKELYAPHKESTASALQQIDTALTEFDLSLPISARMEASPQTICLQTTALTARLLILCPVVRQTSYDTRLEITTQITALLKLYERKHTLRLAPLPMPYHAYVSAATMLDLRTERSDPRSAELLRQLVDALSAMAGAWLTACEALIAVHRRAELKLGPSNDPEDMALLNYLAAKVHKRSGVGYTHGQNDAVADMFSDLLLPGYSIAMH